MLVPTVAFSPFSIVTLPSLSAVMPFVVVVAVTAAPPTVASSPCASVAMPSLPTLMPFVVFVAVTAVPPTVATSPVASVAMPSLSTLTPFVDVVAAYSVPSIVTLPLAETVAVLSLSTVTVPLASVYSLLLTVTFWSPVSAGSVTLPVPVRVMLSPALAVTLSLSSLYVTPAAALSMVTVRFSAVASRESPALRPETFLVVSEANVPPTTSSAIFVPDVTVSVSDSYEVSA